MLLWLVSLIASLGAPHLGTAAGALHHGAIVAPADQCSNGMCTGICPPGQVYYPEDGSCMKPHYCPTCIQTTYIDDRLNEIRVKGRHIA